MKKILILCCALLTFCMAHAQWPKVSTGISGPVGAAVSNYNPDPNWHLGTPNPISTTVTYVQPFLTGTWEQTPVSGSHAGWINPSTSPGNDVPGIYSFERNFRINPGTASFTTNFKVAYDDDLVSLALIPPGAGTPIPLTVVFNNNQNPPQYYLSNLIKKKVNCPDTGIWTIRAKVNYMDGIGGFLLSGRIDTTAGICNTCKCDSTCKLNLTVGGLSGSPFSCGRTIKLKCDKQYDFKPVLTCMGAGCTTSIISVSLTDPSTYTPVWANTFIANNGAGSLFIPAGISPGIYTLTYTYGVPGKKCGTCRFKLNISCRCNCTFDINVDGGSLANQLFNCRDTIPLSCGVPYYFHPNLSCADSSIHFTSYIKDSTGAIPQWAAGFTGIGGITIPSGVSGNYTLTYYWGANGNICDSCKYTVKIVCCPQRCSFFATFSKKAGVSITGSCLDTVPLFCHISYKVTPILNCPGTHITSATLTDANFNTPSWASSFLANGGSGTLPIPSITSGIYTLTYYWGLDVLTCGSCKIFLKITCCDSVKVNAGPDLTTCCPSAGTPLNASASGGVAPYTYSWSPTAGLNYPNIASPISTSTGTYIITVTDAFGCIATDTVKILYSGVNCCRFAGGKTKSQAYPNPFTQGFTLKIPAYTVADVQVTNLYGATVETRSKASGTVQLGAKLAYGAYTVVINYKDGSREQIKVIKSPY